MAGIDGKVIAITGASSQPSPEGLLNTGEVFGLMVAGTRFAECYTAPARTGVDLVWRLLGATPYQASSKPSRHGSSGSSTNW